MWLIMKDLLQWNIRTCRVADILVLLMIQIVISLEEAPQCPDKGENWSGWWSYQGMSAPEHWGDTNTDWSICKTGKNQSPINIQPHSLLYDPHLTPLRVEVGKQVDGMLLNTERDLTFTILHSNSNPIVNITSGPLSYTYRLYQIKLHYGRENISGSEHQIEGKAFSGEIHFMAYNAELYNNHSEAARNPRGIAIIAVFLSINKSTNVAFEVLRKRFHSVKHKGMCTKIKGLPILDLLPKTDHYMTYSGSLTQPSCRETVTWILYNKPIYLSQYQMKELRDIPYQEWNRANTRPVMPLNHRTVRTNINVRKRSRLCTMEVSKAYEVNPQLGQ